jgi:phosphate:Na+ symporter
VSRLDPTIAEAGAAVALEAAWRAILEIARDAVEAVRGRLAGATAKYDPPIEAARRIEHFLESLPLETIDLATIAPRMIRLTHALDHLAELHGDLARALPAVSDRQPPPGTAAGARALAAWLDATKGPEVAVDPTIYRTLEAASKQLAAERDSGRAQLLEDVALQRTPAAAARAGLDALSWSDGALDHAWRLTDSLEAASDKGIQSGPQ